MTATNYSQIIEEYIIFQRAELGDKWGRRYLAKLDRESPLTESDAKRFIKNLENAVERAKQKAGETQ